MSDELFPTPSPCWAATREEALRQLDAFIPASGRYGRDRNHVVPGHTNVSRLSPAIRHRLILESECAAAPLRRYAPSTVEKFTQEVYWRRYWKHWLSLRPQVWTDYLHQLAEIRDVSDASLSERVARCESGASPVAIMNHFARELVETGYLHNHARMWFAGWWIHIERLPWQLGADFFFRHLLDGDPASNTLSWRWVAGHQTPGKTYLPRRSNLEKYLTAELLAEHQEGLDQLERPTALIPPAESRPAITRSTLPPCPEPLSDRLGIWIHEEDLFVEQSPLATLKPVSVCCTGDRDSWEHFGFPASKIHWLGQALADASQRAESAFGTPVRIHTGKPFTQSVIEWAKAHQLKQVAALRPEIGPLNDQLPELQAELQLAGIQLCLLDRPEDLSLRPLATRGFFDFWKRISKMDPAGRS
jgi:deoxyribodipyrimidine photo-lyase